MSELQVVATLAAKPEAVDDLRQALTRLVEATRAEEGSVSYDLFESASAPGVFYTVERWRDQSAFEEHLQTPHLSEAVAAAEGNIVGEIEIHPLVPVS